MTLTNPSMANRSVPTRNAVRAIPYDVGAADIHRRTELDR